MCQAQVYKLSQRAELFTASQKPQQLQTHGKDFERNKNNERYRTVLNSKYAKASWSGKNRLRLHSVLKKTTWFPCLPSPVHELRGTEWNYMDSSNQNGFFIRETRLSCENSLPQDLPMTQVYKGLRAESTNWWKSFLGVAKILISHIQLIQPGRRSWMQDWMSPRKPPVCQAMGGCPSRNPSAATAGNWIQTPAGFDPALTQHSHSDLLMESDTAAVCTPSAPTWIPASLF